MIPELVIRLSPIMYGVYLPSNGLRNYLSYNNTPPLVIKGGDVCHMVVPSWHPLSWWMG